MGIQRYVKDFGQLMAVAANSRCGSEAIRSGVEQSRAQAGLVLASRGPESTGRGRASRSGRFDLGDAGPALASPGGAAHSPSRAGATAGDRVSALRAASFAGLACREIDPRLRAKVDAVGHVHLDTQVSHRSAVRVADGPDLGRERRGRPGHALHIHAADGGGRRGAPPRPTVPATGADPRGGRRRPPADAAVRVRGARPGRLSARRDG